MRKNYKTDKLECQIEFRLEIVEKLWKISEKMLAKAFAIQFIFIVVALASGDDDDDVEHRGELRKRK